MTTSHSDPGEQERGTRRKPRRAAPLTAPGQGDLLSDPEPRQPPRGPSEGDRRKEKAIGKHEASSRAPLLRFLRRGLKDLQTHRDGERINRLFGSNPVPTINDKTFVTADDAVRLLEMNHIRTEKEDGTPEPRNWLGALFKEKGWRYTGKTVPSLRPEANGRHVRCWRWEGE